MSGVRGHSLAKVRGAEPLACPALQSDYGLMVFADIRYQRHDKRDKLPGWITSQLRDAHLNLSTDMLLAVARQFMRGMGQVRWRRLLHHTIMAACRCSPESPVHTCCCPLFADLCQGSIVHMLLFLVDMFMIVFGLCSRTTSCKSASRCSRRRR